MPLTTKMTLLKRIVVWLFAISTVTFIILAFMGYEIRDTIRQKGLERITQILSQKHREIDGYIRQQYISLGNLERLVFSVSRHHAVFTPVFWGSPPEALESNLAAFAAENGFYDIFLIAPEGQIVYSVKKEEDLNTNLFNGPFNDSELARVFKDALKKHSPHVSGFYFYKPSRNYAAFIAIPVINGTEIVGVIAVQIDNTALQSVINDNIGLGRSGEMIVTVSRENELLMMAPVRNSGIKAFSEADPDLMKFMNLIIGQKQGHGYMQNREGKDAAVAWDYDKELRWTFVATIDEEELLDEWHKQTTSLVILFFLGAFIVISMVVAAFRSFARPINELTEYALMMSEGYYDIDLNIQKYDSEWQILIRVFKQLSVEISKRMEQLKEKNLLLSLQKEKIEELNQNLEAKVLQKSRQLQEYVNIVDQYVITSQTDASGKIIYASEAFCQISGYTKEELIGQSHRIVRHPDMSSEVFETMWKTISSGGIWTGELKNLKSDGGFYWVDTAISPTYQDGVIVGYTAIRHDITNRKKIEELVITDSMTGLFNRRHYGEVILSEMYRCRRNEQTFAMMMVDVDNFKLYNDTYGHHAGDNVLIRVSEVFHGFTSRSGDYAFRIGGEEFVLLVTNESDDAYRNLAERIRSNVEALELPHKNNTASPFVTISVGMVIVYSHYWILSEDLYQYADKQLYQAKEQGRNRVVTQVLK